MALMDESPPAVEPAAEELAGPPMPTVVKRADWVGLLTPLAVIVGSVVIAAAVWLWAGGDPGPRGVTKAELDAALAPLLQSHAAAAPAAAQGGSTSPAQATTLEAVFKMYVKQLGIDETKFLTCLSKPATGQLLNTQLNRGVQLGVSGTPTFVINNKLVVGAQPTAIFDEIIAAELMSSPMSVDGYSESVKKLAAQGQFKILAAKVDVSDATFEGDPNAKVVIAEFSDFQCPFCKRWTEENIMRLRPKLGKDIAIAFLHFPIVQIHPNAANASAAAICAGEQGKFWQMHDLLFVRQAEWQNLK
jgi:protein-disulfide isomerase